MPRVSVVIPAYNAVRFLPETVASALSQTWRDFEIIVVDDGSTDGTDAWAARHPDRRVRLIRQPNRGAATARNRGIAAATGDYIALLDADDLWEPTKLEQQVALLDCRPEVGLVHTAVCYIDENGGETGRMLDTYGDGDVWREVVLHMLVRCGSTPLVRRECFETVGVFDTDLSFAEDWDMWVRISARYHFAVIHKPMVLYRQHNANMTKGYQVIAPNLERVLERAFRNAPRKTGTLKRKAYGRAYLFAAWRAFQAGDNAEAASLLRRALRCSPELYCRRNSLALGLKLAQAGLVRRNAAKEN